MNRYFEIGVAYQEQAETEQQAVESLNHTCHGVPYEGGHTCGCHFQATCDESRCPVMKAFKARMEYLKSLTEEKNITFVFTAEMPTPKKKQILSQQYKAKTAVVKYLDRVISKVASYDRKLVILLENVTVQIYAQKDLYAAMAPLKESYPEIFYKAARLYWKYGV